jgi:UDP-glucose 4-epimerase
MKVLIFGGNGFLGKAVKQELENNQISCYTVSRSGEASDYKVDIGKIDDFKNLPNDFFDIVINCATILPGGNYLDSLYLDQIYKTNILGSQNICSWISKQSTIDKIINCSTLVVVKKPWNMPLIESEENTYPAGKHILYCASKLTQELIFKTFATDFKIKLAQIRFSALYGKGMNWSGLICNFIDQAKNTQSIRVTNGSKINADFIYITDAAKIIVETINSNVHGIINGASGIETSILNVANCIKDNFYNQVSVVNEETNETVEDRSLISVEKLNSILTTASFITLDQGLKKMLL